MEQKGTESMPQWLVMAQYHYHSEEHWIGSSLLTKDKGNLTEQNYMHSHLYGVKRCLFSNTVDKAYHFGEILFLGIDPKTSMHSLLKVNLKKKILSVN